MAAKILCVDDDINILVGFQRNLRRRFHITNALGGAAALKILDEHGPFDVILSDMRMPGMSGSEFLARASEKSPDSIQVVLTGAADMDMAVEAATSGRIHRFLIKPCPLDRLMETLTAAVDLHTANEDARRAATPMRRSTDRPLAQPKLSGTAGDLATDPVTGLPTAEEAEAAIRAIADFKDTRIAVFYIERMQFNKERFGPSAARQVIHFGAQHLAGRLCSLWREPGLFRWHGPSFLIVSSGLADVLITETKSLAAVPVDYHFETRSRSVFVPVKFASAVIEAEGLEATEILARLDEFVAHHAES